MELPNNKFKLERITENCYEVAKNRLVKFKLNLKRIKNLIWELEKKSLHKYS